MRSSPEWYKAMASSLVITAKKDLSEVLNQRVKEDGFNRGTRSIVDIPFTTTFGETHMHPVGGLIAGALKSFAIHKGLQKDDRVAVDALPVPGEDSGHSPQDVRGQAGNSNPGKNEESSILGDEGNVSISVSGLPTDELIPTSHFPGRRSPTEASQRTPLVENHVLEVFPHGLTVPQVMIGVDEPLVQRFPMGTSHHLELEGIQFMQRALNRLSGVKWNLNRSPSAASASVLYRRKFHHPCPLQTQQEITAGHGLKHAISLSPIPETAELFGDKSPAAALMLLNNKSDDRNIIGGDLSAPDDKSILHGPWYNTMLSKTPEKNCSYILFG